MEEFDFDFDSNENNKPLKQIEALYENDFEEENDNMI